MNFTKTADLTKIGANVTNISFALECERTSACNTYIIYDYTLLTGSLSK